MLYLQVMWVWLKSLYGLLSRSLVWPLVLIGTIGLAGCSQIPNFLLGGGPNVAANTQLGETNNQTLGTTEITSIEVKDSQSVSIENDKQELKTDKVDNVTINKTEPWVILLLLLGWLLPSPSQIGGYIGKLFIRNK